MKLIISGVVVLLCIQIDASRSPSSKECQRNLCDRKSDIANFFRKFSPEHNIAHNDYLALKDICDILKEAYAILTSDNCGCDQSSQDTECRIAEFLDTFFHLRIKAVYHITHLLYECDVLLDMADQFICGLKLVSNDDKTCSGCEAELNALDSDLADFFKDLKRAGAKAKELLFGILSTCETLNNKAREFSCKYRPSCNGCGCSGGDGVGNNNLLAGFKHFNTEFAPLFNDASAKLLDLGEICAKLVAAINTWRQRV